MKEQEKISVSKKNWFSESLKYSKESLAFIVSIITSVLFILNKIGTLSFISDREILIGVDFLNFLVLFLAFLAIKDAIIEKDDDEFQNYIQPYHKLYGKTEIDKEKFDRANTLVSQLVFCTRWFVIILGSFYILQIIVDAFNHFDFSQIKNEALESRSVTHLLALQKINSANFFLLEILANASNLFNATFLFIAFQVLFIKTVDTDHKSWRLLKKGKAYLPATIAFIIILLNVAFYLCGLNNFNLAQISITTSLIIGIYSGMAMMLLFSRFISIEYFFRQSNPSNWQMNFYLVGTVIILPLYAVIQPLYGLINAVEIESSAELFKSIIFLICFLGKLVLLLFIYTMLKKKLIHSYLYIALLQPDIQDTPTVHNFTQEDNQKSN